MRKTLLTMTAALMALSANAQGITAVGANIPVVPSSRWSNEAWKAKTLIVNPGFEYGEWNDQNPNYNMVLLDEGVAVDANGKQWYELGYDESTPTEDYYGCTEDGFFHWVENTAPFSSDAEWGGKRSCQWTKSSMIADIYIRRTFTTDKLLSGDVYLACGHDDAPCEYYINGVLVWSKTGYEIDHWEYIYDEWEDEEGNIQRGEILDSIPHYKNGWNNDEVYKLTDEQKDLIRLGGEENLLAVHVHQNWGGAFADCGLYTLVPGGVEMGYVKSWDGKVIYNSYGGYNYSGNNDKHALHNWEKLYEAQEGDVYTVPMEGSSEGEWQEQMHFKTPIVIQEGHEYTFKCTINPSCDYDNIRVKLTENDNDEIVLSDETASYSADEDNEYEVPFDGQNVKNFKVVFDFGGGEEGSTIKLSNISLYDETEEKELWVGTHYFNFFYMTKTTGSEEEGNLSTSEIKWPEVEGRVETMAWTQADFDDEMWETWAMPTGNAGYMGEVKTIWPGGENTNLWVRRTFDIDKINPRLSYALNVCHDDNYETYVNGHLLQKNTGWTDGKNPVQVHIPARYLNEGKNVIATYIQQNWGGKFYDCGINVEEVNYQECADALKAAIALGEGEHPELTAKMQADLVQVVADGRNELATNMDAAEVKEYAKNMKADVQRILGYANDVRIIRETIAICQKEDKGYISDAIADAVANVDTCATPGQMDPMLQKLRANRKKQAAERREDKFTGVALEDIVPYGEYYIFNVKDKRFLGGGENWGTHLATEYVSNAFTLWDTDRDNNDLEKGFRVETMRANGQIGTNDFMNYGGYVDTDTNDAWEFIPVEGKTNVFNIARASVEYETEDIDEEGNPVIGHTNTREDGSRFLLGIRDGGENGLNIGFNSWNCVDTDMSDPANEGNQWMLITVEELDALLEGASKDNPVDASHLIVNPGFDQRLPIDYWYDNGINGGRGVWDRGGNHADFVFENWNTDRADVEQTIEILPAGWYEVDVQGYYRDGHYTTHMRKVGMGIAPERRAFLVAFADMFIEDAETIEKEAIASFSDGINMVPGLGRRDDFKVDYKDVDEEGNEVTKTYQGDGTRYATDACWSAAEEFFQNGLYWNRMVVYVPEGQPLTIGAIKDGREDGDWLVVDNWRLKYLGNEDAPEEIIDAVKDVTAPVASANTIYNLNGQKVVKANKGVYIVNGQKRVIK